MNYLVNLSHVLNHTSRNSSQTQKNSSRKNEGSSNPQPVSTPTLKSSDSFSNQRPASRGQRLQPPTNPSLTPSPSQKSASGPLEKQPSKSEGKDMACDVSSSVTQGNTLEMKLPGTQEPVTLQLGGVSDHELSEMPAGARTQGNKGNKGPSAGWSQYLPVQLLWGNSSANNKTQTHHQAQLQVSVPKCEGQREGEFKTPVGLLKGSVQGNGPKLSAEGELKTSKDHLTAHGKVQGAVLEAATEAELAGKMGDYLTARLKAEVNGGIKGDAVASVVYDPKKNTYMAKLGWSGQVGSEAKILGELDLGAIRFSAGLSAQQGLNASLGIGGGVKDGCSTLGVDLSGALGLGAGVNLGVTVDGPALYAQFQKLRSSVDHEQYARQRREATPSDLLINAMSGMAY